MFYKGHVAKYLGRYTREELIAKKDKEDIKTSIEIAPEFKYVYCEEVKKNGKVVALDIYLSCDYF